MNIGYTRKWSARYGGDFPQVELFHNNSQQFEVSNKNKQKQTTTNNNKQQQTVN